jgi:dTDP-4-amino-4,6-dideoxygalactose transaminase
LPGASAPPPHARATASGREALGLILDALGLGPGDELIIPAYTLGELLPLLQGKGLTLVPADIDPETFNMTPETVAACLSPHTRGVPLIEDCAHATGASVAGRAVGSFGQAALFSLEPTKPVGAFGGGVLTTADTHLVAEVDRVMARRRQRQWPAMRKALVKWAEEVMVRSPLYGPVARRLFAEDSAERFDAFYRRANARTRSTAEKFSAYQAAVAGPQLDRLDERN